MDWVKIPPAEWLETENDIIDTFSWLKQNSPKGIAYDTETTGVKTYQDIPLLASFSEGTRRFAFEADWLRHPLVLEILEGDCIKKGSNIKFDLHMTENIGIKLNGPLHDTLVMDYLFDENRQGRHGLKEISRDYCGILMREFKEVFPMIRKRKGFADDTAGDAIRRKMSTPEGKKDAIEYSGLDAYASFKVADYLEAELKKIPVFEGFSLWDYFERIEAPFTRVLYNLERRGFTICAGYFKEIEIPMQKAILEIEHQFNKAAGGNINMNSPIQLRELFYNVLGKTATKWTSGGTSGNKQPATDAEVLEAWAEEGDPYASMVVKHRKLSKIYDTYVTGLQELLDKDFKLHTSLNQAVAVTGRLSSSNPNCQNIKRNIGKGDKLSIREGFIASPGCRLIVADYSQLEMMIMAHKSSDPIMIDAISNGKDLHCLAVALIFGYPYEDVIAAKKAEKHGGELTKLQRLFLELRQAMKNVGYGIIYGIGPPKLAHDLTEEFQKSDKNRVVTEQEAQSYIDSWYGLFKTVKQYVAYQQAYVKEHGYVQTFLGRYRRLPEINSSRYKDKLKAQRQAVNIIQGDAADIMKIAMMAIENDMRLTELGCKQLLQVHDEDVCEAEDEDNIITECKVIIKDHMEHSFERNVFPLKVPLSVEIGDGYTWATAK